MQTELLFKNETLKAPTGFFAMPKTEVNNAPEFDNICRYCDARLLCQKNENSWCAKNPCMSYSRQDGIGVVFKSNNN